MEAQILRLAEAADHLVRNLPQFEPKPHNSKKKICKDLEVRTSVVVLNWTWAGSFLIQGKSILFVNIVK
jgi:hypothetical protein